MPLRRDPMTGRLVHYPFADPPPDKVSSLTSVGGAPVGSPFVTIGNDATLTAERALAVTAGHLTLTDGGANASVTLGLASVIAAAGPIGSATVVPIITYDAQGRLTTVTSTTITGVTPGGAAGGDLTGTYPNPTLAAIIAAGGPIGSTTVTPIITYDAKGRLTVVSSATIAPLATSIASPAALTKVDDTNVTLTLGGTPATALLRATSLTLGWTGTLAVARGGTGNAALGALTKVDDTNVTLTLGGSPTTALVNAASITVGWSGLLGLSRGGTNANLSATGGTSQVLRQSSAGAAVTVSQLAFSDISGSVTDAQVPDTITLSNLTQITTRSHASLQNLTADDHTQYTLLAGRTGTTNDTTLSTSGDGTLTGSSNAASALNLKAASSGAGLINAVDEFRFRTGFTTLAGAGGANTYLSRAVLATTITSLANVTRVVGVTGTVDDQSGVNFLYLFSNEATYKRTTSAVFGGYTISALNNIPTIQADGVAITSGTAQGFNHNPTYNIANAGTFSGLVDNAVICNITVATGVTMTARRGLYFQNASVTGTLTTQAAVDIEALTSATTNIGIRNASTYVSTPLERQLAAAGNAISATAVSGGSATKPRAETIRLNNTSGGALTLTSTPTVSDGEDGQLLILFNSSTQNVVIQDEGTLAGSNLRLAGAANLTLGQRDAVVLLFSSTLGDWIQIGASNN